MIEKSVIAQYKLKKFHIVAHSLGCVLALALTVKHPGAIKSLTLLAPVSQLYIFTFNNSLFLEIKGS